MSAEIEHIATVLTISPGGDSAVVVIDSVSSESDCGGCHLAAVCNGGRRMELCAEIAVDCRLFPGDKVVVSTSSHSRIRAIVLLLLLPVFIMLAVACVADLSGLSSAAVAWISLLSLFIAGAVVFAIGRYFPSRPVWSVIKKSEI